MKRFKLTIEYEGTPFKGWQRQPDFMSVQQVIEDAAFGVEGEPVTVFGAGRTDAGVHALGQVAHIDMRKDITIGIRYGEIICGKCEGGVFADHFC